MSLTLEQLDHLEIQILELLEAEEYEQAEKLLDSFTYLRETKIEAYCHIINKLNARAQWRRDEAQRLRSRADIDQDQSDWLKGKLHTYFESHGIKTLETDRYKVTLAKNGGKAPLVITADTSDLPDDYTQTELLVKPDKEAIREALEQGQELPFAHLGERGSSIRIK
ncbi:MAG: siphovirus Gp157 family protein [Synechococcaceae cyanobacterium SM2_3_2]|nr:siphovirus Gp157 family protein [Synechococcaceae cyanobacterium SM2_3_2]